MTDLLEQALAELQKRPSAEQDAIAALILEELADESRWDASFARSQAQLSQLAQQARQQVQAGQVQRIGIDEL